MRLVKHDDAVWKIVDENILDDRRAYELERREIASWQTIDGVRRPVWRRVRLSAFADECVPITVNRKRSFKDADGSITFEGGIVKVRVKGARKFWTTSIAGIITMCARAEAGRAKLEREFKRRTRRRS
jgi:hypothetical protein